jgi:hypothetical protein
MSSSLRDMTEALHKVGEEGVLLVKQMLESTTHVEIFYTVYDSEPNCKLMMADGSLKTFDMIGLLLKKKPVPIAVEGKNYKTVGDQPALYKEFLAQAYSATLADIQSTGDRKMEFMWVTGHPFAQSKWPKLTRRKEIKAAVAAHPHLLGGAEIDEDMVELVRDRLWLMVTHHRQAELLLSRDEYFKVSRVLKRKK